MASRSLMSQTTRIIASRRCLTAQFRSLLVANSQHPVSISSRSRGVVASRSFGSISATTASSGNNNNLQKSWRSGIPRASSRRALSTTEAGESAQAVSADTYIEELQDLYEIAQDELEIASESTSGATIYAASDRVTLREAFEDLEHAYTAYTGSTPTTSYPSPPSTPTQSPSQQTESEASASTGGSGSGEMATEGGVEGGGAAGSDGGERQKSTNHDSTNIPDETREEIKRRVGQRVREMKNAVESLEESANEG